MSDSRPRRINPALTILLVACVLPACGWTESKYISYVNGEGAFIEGTQQNAVTVSGFDSSRSEIDLRQLEVVQLNISPKGPRPNFDSLQLTLQLAGSLSGVGEPQISAVHALLYQGDKWTELSASDWTINIRLVIDQFEDAAPEELTSWGDRALTQQASGRFAAVFTSTGQQFKVQSCTIKLEVYKEKAGLLE